MKLKSAEKTCSGEFKRVPSYFATPPNAQIATALCQIVSRSGCTGYTCVGAKCGSAEAAHTASGCGLYYKCMLGIAKT